MVYKNNFLYIETRLEVPDNKIARKFALDGWRVKGQWPSFSVVCYPSPTLCTPPPSSLPVNCNFHRTRHLRLSLLLKNNLGSGKQCLVRVACMNKIVGENTGEIRHTEEDWRKGQTTFSSELPLSASRSQS